MSKDITILLADDNESMLEMLEFLITRQGHLKVLGIAKSGQQAIELAVELKPDITILDINMSPVNGFEAARKIIKILPEAKIIGLSVNREASYARNMISLGAKGYLTKSSESKEIIDAIHQVANGETYICREILDGNPDFE